MCSAETTPAIGGCRPPAPAVGGCHPPIRRLAVLSMHTSPLAQPGTGDAGGLNVLVAQTADRLARRGIEVDVFTAAGSPDAPPAVPLGSGVVVHHVPGVSPGRVDSDPTERLVLFARGVERALHGRSVDLVHSHYWLSGLVGLAVAGRWRVPLVHSAHTLGRVKNAAASPGDKPEPPERILGEEQLAQRADRLVAATRVEAAEWADLYGADPGRVLVIPPGVDTEVFRPGDTVGRLADRDALGLAVDEVVIAFAGRIQPHKGPSVLVKAVGELRRRHPERRWRVLVVGGQSGSDHSEVDRLADLAARDGIGDAVQIIPAMPPSGLAHVYRAVDAVAVPSRSESFGLVSLEAQAAGTPVVAAAVGGLPIVVQDGVTGVLVDGYEAADWADALASVVLDRARRDVLGAAAHQRAQRFSWEATVDRLLDGYAAAVAGRAVVRA